jgi:hypothetical protein
MVIIEQNMRENNSVGCKVLTVFALARCSGEEMGLVTHIHTAVYVKGIAAARKLKSHCVTCPAHMSVRRNTPHPLLVSASPDTSVSKHHVYMDEWYPTSISHFKVLNVCHMEENHLRGLLKFLLPFV